jgi:hypothetical protein
VRGGSAPGGKEVIGRTAVWLRGSTVRAGAGIRCPDRHECACASRQRPAGTGGKSPTSSPADRTQIRIGVRSEKCLRADRVPPTGGADRGQTRSRVALWARRCVLTMCLSLREPNSVTKAMIGVHECGRATSPTDTDRWTAGGISSVVA